MEIKAATGISEKTKTGRRETLPLLLARRYQGA